MRRCIRRHRDEGRTRISLDVCDELGWKQPNGWPKDRACRDALLRMERLGMIELPPRVKARTKPTRKARRSVRRGFLFRPIATDPEVELVFAKGDSAEVEWNRLVSEHHYLGHRASVGRCIKYLVKHKGRVAGAISFTSATWQTAVRDSALKEVGLQEEAFREQVVNNSRFLILPDVSVPNLASRILSLATRQVAHDWAEFYSVAPLIAETFVQPSRFLGTCYKAANWVYVGKTKGYAKSGSSHMNSREPKLVFLYGLNTLMRRRLAELGRDCEEKEGIHA